MGSLPSCWSRESKRFQKNTATAAAFGCLPELERKTLVLRTPNSLDIGPGGIELEMAWKCTRGLAIIYLKILRKLPREKSSQLSYPVVKLKQQRHFAQEDIPKGAIVALTSWE